MSKITIQPNHGDLLHYLHNLSIKNNAARFDSRIIFKFVHCQFGYMNTSHQNSKRQHADWMTFIKKTKTQLESFGEVKIVLAPNQEKFTMLTLKQASILICFDVYDTENNHNIPNDQMFQDILNGLEYLEKTEAFKYSPNLLTKLVMVKTENKTLEETKEKKETPLKKEKRIEKEFGESLAAKGISVQYQVSCEHGIADIVTPDAIYEIKASLSRSTIHKATSQVLLYRNCINPSAKAVIVGCIPKKESNIDTKLATSLGVEIIIWEDKN